MSSVQEELQAAAIAREYDESFDYDITDREKVALVGILFATFVGVALLVLGLVKLAQIQRHTECIEAETARIVAESNETCRAIREAAAREREAMFAAGDSPIMFKEVK